MGAPQRRAADDPHARSEGEVATHFEGFHWFPIDPNYRVTARFIKDPAPHEFHTPNQTGDDQVYKTEGVVEFTLNGETVRMRPATTRPKRLYFIFRDGTSGKETYDTARFLYSDLKEDGTTVLDFNQAYNPPCAFNPYTTCPLPPEGESPHRADSRGRKGVSASAGAYRARDARKVQLFLVHHGEAVGSCGRSASPAVGARARGRRAHGR